MQAQEEAGIGLCHILLTEYLHTSSFFPRLETLRHFSRHKVMGYTTITIVSSIDAKTNISKIVYILGTSTFGKVDVNANWSLGCRLGLVHLNIHEILYNYLNTCAIQQAIVIK